MLPFLLLGMRHSRGGTFPRLPGIILRTMMTLAAGFCIVMAIYCPIDTLKTFPDDSFGELLPGLVLFPIIFVCFAAICLIDGWILVQLKAPMRPASPQKEEK